MKLQLPSLGEGIDSGTVVKVLVKTGQQIKKDQDIIEIETEKTVAGVPAEESGTVDEVLVGEGDQLKVGEAILKLSDVAKNGTAKSDEDEEKSKDEKSDADGNEPKDEGTDSSEPQQGKPEIAEAGQKTGSIGKPSRRLPASPSVRRMIRELGIDAKRISSSKRGERIERDDLRRYIEGLQELNDGQGGNNGVCVCEPDLPDFSSQGEVEFEDLSSVRQTIGQTVVRNWTLIPQVTQFGEADITHLTQLVDEHAKQYEKQDARLTLTVILIKELVEALKAHSAFNASLSQKRGEVIYKKHYHIGIAVATDRGLIIPVLRDANRKSALDIAKELRDLATKARDRKLGKDDTQGATFTLSNQGGIGGGAFTPIVNWPQSAILGLGRAATQPRHHKKEWRPRTILPLALSYDHRLIDGAMAANFITELAERLENVNGELLQI